MTAVDTNVLVRVVTNDDHAQAARATAYLRAQERVFIPKTVLLELEWVLRGAYAIRRAEILLALRGLVGISNVEIEDEAAVTQAIEWYARGIDFADSLHVSSAGRESKFATFDSTLRRKGRKLGLGEFAAI
jgi:predicted nucleic-acid-binding protein